MAKWCYAFACCLFIVPEGQAQQTTNMISKDQIDIIVSGSLSPIGSDQLSRRVTARTEEEIIDFSPQDILELSHGIPGVQATRNGGPGSRGSLRIRGAEGYYMKATLDGIDLSDVTAPQTEPLLNFLPVMGMSRVEVLRGSSGPLYGANAVSGVVNAKIFDAGQQAKSSQVGLLRVRQNGDLDGYTKFQTSDENIDFGLYVSGYEIQNRSSIAQDQEKDASSQKFIATSLQHEFSPGATLEFVAQYGETETEYDSKFELNVPEADIIGQHVESKAYRLSADMPLLETDAWLLTGVFSFQQRLSDRVEQYSSGSYVFDGTRYFYDARDDYLGDRRHGDARFILDYDLGVVSFGGAYTDERLKLQTSEGYLSEGIDSWGLYAESILKPFDKVSTHTGLRWENHAYEDNFLTFAFGSRLELTNWLSVQGNVETGYRAPSLYELYRPSLNSPDNAVVGASGLSAEKSRSFDMGFEVMLDDVTVGLQLFKRDIKNKIFFDDDLYVASGYQDTRYVQSQGTSTAYGLEWFTTWALDPLHIHADYTYTLSRNNDVNGKQKIANGVPRHAGQLGFYFKEGSWNAGLRSRFHMSTRFDTSSEIYGLFDPHPMLDDFFVVDIHARYQVSKNITIHADINNLFDDRYTLSDDFVGNQTLHYLQPGLGVFTGVSFAF